MRQSRLYPGGRARRDLRTAGSAALSIAGVESSDVGAFTIAASSALSLSATESPDTASLTIAASSGIALAAVEGADLGSFVIDARSALTITGTESSDVGDLVVRAGTAYTIAGIEGSDVGALGLNASSAITVAGVETPDNAALIIRAGAAYAIAGTESQDVAALTIAARSALTVASTEGADVGAFAATAVAPSVSLTIGAMELADTAQIGRVSIVGLPRITSAIFAGRIFESIRTRWTLTPIAWPNVHFDPDDLTDPLDGWMRPSIVHSGGEIVALATTDYRRFGSLFLQTFVPEGAARARSNALVEHAVDYFNDPPSFFPGSVRFGGASVSDVGVEGGWYQVNVVAGFSYDMGIRGATPVA